MIRISVLLLAGGVSVKVMGWTISPAGHETLHSLAGWLVDRLFSHDDV